MNDNESLAHVRTQRMLSKSEDFPNYTGVEGTFSSHRVKIKGFPILKNFTERTLLSVTLVLSFNF